MAGSKTDPPYDLYLRHTFTIHSMATANLVAFVRTTVNPSGRTRRQKGKMKFFERKK
ncbi:hypothetical protein KQH82_05485 [bacterium]|nr:hypothetical protein [bacterium]